MTTLEREVKLRFDSVEDARAALVTSDATPLRCRRLQEDYLLDDAAETLHHRRCVLRVRVEAGKSLVTFKGPVQVSLMKVREELETVVGDGDTMLRCFEHLGYRVWFRYQKYREEWRVESEAEGLLVSIDETPVGSFAELEGAEGAIRRLAGALGHGEHDFIRDSYYTLHVRACAERGESAGHMLFPAGG